MINLLVLLPVPDRKFHAGLSDEAEEGIWVWVNGAQVDPGLWHDKQPDNGLGTGQNYGVIWKVRKFPKFLNDDDMVSLHYICEMSYSLLV